MSERNYIPGLPLGKHRREVSVPEKRPHLDVEGLMAVSDWRHSTYKQPFLDDLLGYYRFSPPTKNGAERYTGAKSRATGFELLAREVVARYVELPENIENPALRQIIHKAETTEMATALFWSVAVLRSEVITRALGNVSDGKEIEDDVLAYAADAIIDVGLCLEQPYEPNFKLKESARKRTSPQGLDKRLNQIAPSIGSSLVDFGAYAGENSDLLYSYDGVAALQFAADEQDYRIGVWSPRHRAITEAFPDLPLSREILYMQMSLQEMLSAQGQLAG